MIDPITGALIIGGTAQLVSAGMQWLNSKNAQEAAEAEREQIRNLLNQLKDPNFDKRNITPESVALLQQYVPEVSPFVKEAIPQQVLARSQGAVEGRRAQMESLGYMRRLMQQGYDPQTAIEMARAQRAGAAEASSARQTAGAEAARRGFGGGLSFYQTGAGAEAQDRLAQAQQAALAQAAQRRMAAAGQAAALGGQIRGEDVALERGNIDIINAYNQRMAQAQQNWLNQGTDVRNQAQLRNIGEAQRIDEMNKRQRYEASRANQQQQNTLAQQQYQNALSKVTGQQGVSQMAREDAYANAARQNAAWQAASDLASKGAGAYAGYQQQQANRDWEREKFNRMYPERG